MRLMPPSIGVLVPLVALVLFGERALSFPENTRHGYPSCSACHVTPSGGGALNEYGRGASEAFMTTWSREGEGNFGYGLLGKLPSWLVAGGDQRGVGVYGRTSDGTVYRQTVPMEAAVELALVGDGITIDARGGVYGPDHDAELRSFYAMAKLFRGASIRAGKFIPAFGVALEDHTSVTRAALGLGQGGETYNSELSVLAPQGEVIATAIMGQDAEVSDGDPALVGTWRSDSMIGGAVRAAGYVGTSSSVGLSAMWLRSMSVPAERRVLGSFAQLGLSTRAFVLAELDRISDDQATPVAVAMLKAGYELFAGVIPYVQLETLGRDYSGRVGTQWQPRPHYEVRLEGRWSESQRSIVGLLHHWL